MAEKKLTISIADSGRVILVGDITHKTVMSVLNKNVFNAKSQVIVDFAGVLRSDSSGLALMTRWARQAKKSNVEIYYECVPEKLAALAKMSGLDTILSISAKES